MNSILAIYDTNELVRVGKLSVDEGKDRIVEIIKQSAFYPVMKYNYSYAITLIDTSITPKELSESVDRYFRHLLTFCEKTSCLIASDMKCAIVAGR